MSNPTDSESLREEIANRLRVVERGWHGEDALNSIMQLIEAEYIKRSQVDTVKWLDAIKEAEQALLDELEASTTSSDDIGLINDTVVVNRLVSFIASKRTNKGGNDE